MSDPDPAIQELQTTVAALRAELDIKDLHRVVQITADDGRRDVSIKCHSLAIRTRGGERSFAILLGASDNRGFISFYYPDDSKGDIALNLGINERGQPAIRLSGEDNKDRVQLTIDKDHGMAAFFAPGYKPGAVIRAVHGGGSFAVVQPDGKTRGMLMHSDGKNTPGGRAGTELLIANDRAQTVLALHADDQQSILSLNSPDATNGVRLVAREKSGSLVLRGAGFWPSARR